MSTSDQERAAGFPTTDFDDRLKPSLPVDETSVAGSLPDVTMLTRLANEFFRAQPAQGYPTTLAPFTPDAQDLTPAFETRLPEFGMPLPSLPAIPSAGKVPMAPDVPGLSSATPELSPFMLGPAAAVALPAATPIPEAGMLQHDPRSAAAVPPLSPFSLPMPQFGATFPSFEAGVPALPPLPPLRTEDDARSALTTTSPFYFLENAGGLNGSAMAPTRATFPAELSSRPVSTVSPKPRFRHPPSRFQCRSSMKHCFRLSKQQCPG